MSAPLRQAARALRSRQTPTEQYLWQGLRAGRLDGLSFRRQQPVGPYIVDFYCSAARLVIEVDGAVHAGQVEYGQERDAYLAAYGLRVLRFTNDAVERDLAGVLAAIRSAIGTSPTLPSSGGTPHKGGSGRRPAGRRGGVSPVTQQKGPQ